MQSMLCSTSQVSLMCQYHDGAGGKHARTAEELASYIPANLVLMSTCEDDVEEGRGCRAGIATDRATLLQMYLYRLFILLDSSRSLSYSRYTLVTRRFSLSPAAL